MDDRRAEHDPVADRLTVDLVLDEGWAMKPSPRSIRSVPSSSLLKRSSAVFMWSEELPGQVCNSNLSEPCIPARIRLLLTVG